MTAAPEPATSGEADPDNTDMGERAFELYNRGNTWQQVADQLGYSHRSSAKRAAEAYLQREAHESTATSRLYNERGYMLLIGSMTSMFEQARAEGRRMEANALARTIGQLRDRWARLSGQYVPVEQHVHVQVKSSAVVVLEDARQQFRAIAERELGAAGELPAGAVVDGEVVE
tara:strand:- start:899 stop:1417 length:519 start_codon:yes stop_codon:yes gene_type:complete